jgi:hypothetical protein
VTGQGKKIRRKVLQRSAVEPATVASFFHLSEGWMDRQAERRVA